MTPEEAAKIEAAKKAAEGISVKIGEETKVFTPDQVIDMSQRIDAAGLVEATAAEISTAAGKYETDPTTYIKQAEGAFSAMTKLINLGVIDEAGNVLAKKAEGDPKQPLPPTGDPTVIPKPDDKPDLKVLVADAVKEVLVPLVKDIDQVKDDVGGMYRMDLEGKLQAKHPDLDSDDVSRIFGTAMNDQKKTLWEHAEEFSKTKVGKLSELKKAHAKEFGINLDEFEARNKLKEQSAAGGAVIFAKGKTLSLSKRDRGKDASKDTVSPREAMMDFFKAQ